MGFFERYLSVWVGLCIVAGVTLGVLFPPLFQAFAAMEVAHVNLPVALFIWLMIYPMMVQVDFTSIKDIGKKPNGLVLTLVINWLIKPFTMAALGWLFFKVIFADLVDPQTASEYIAGMILLGVAPCTAMVFVWSQLTKGDANYTLVQVSVNDVIMIFAFAPIAAFLLGVSDVAVPWETLLLSVVLYVVIPLVAGVLTRSVLDQANDHHRLNQFLESIKPISVSGLLATVVLLFGFQAETILSNPLAIVLIAIPLLLQTYGIFALAYAGAKAMKLPHNIAAPACMIGTSNFFELAVAVAISLFGLQSGAALATVVGVLVEVPVMLSLCAFANRTRHWFEEAQIVDDLPNIDRDCIRPVEIDKLYQPQEHKPRILLLYGSLRKRSFSRLAAAEAARLLEYFGAETRTFDPSGLPLPDDSDDSHPKVQELRELAAWSEGMVWCSPERHGAMTGIMKAQIDWIPLSIGAVRPTQGKTLAVMQVCGGSQSFNAVNQMRVLGRWMRMLTIPNQSSVPKAWMEFDDDDRMKPSSFYDRIVDVMEELVKFTLLTRGSKDYFVDRYSERKESEAAFRARIDQRAMQWL